MSRLDPNVASTRSIVNLGPDSVQIRETISNKVETSGDLGPIQNAASYGKRVQARRSQAADVLKGKGQPLGGAPPLDHEKMSALAHSMLPQPQFDVGPPLSDKPPEGHDESETPQMGGVGSAYHINREMARGNVDRPISMKEARQMNEDAQKNVAQPTRKFLSPETLQALQMAKESLQPQEESPPHKESPLKTDSTSAELEKATERMVNPRPEMFDFEAVANAQKGLLNPDRRKKIESALEPMDIGDMITRREIQQSVPVIPNKLVYQFRTFNQHENLFCLRYVYEYNGSVAYVEELLNTCKLVCALVAVNGALLPDHRKAVGTDKEEVDKELFQKKMFHVANLPVQMIADISANAIWFNERITKLFSVENLKNG